MIFVSMRSNFAGWLSGLLDQIILFQLYCSFIQIDGRPVLISFYERIDLNWTTFSGFGVEKSQSYFLWVECELDQFIIIKRKLPFLISSADHNTLIERWKTSRMIIWDCINSKRSWATDRAHLKLPWSFFFKRKIQQNNTLSALIDRSNFCLIL